jgi:hypothetical protein
MLPTMLLDENIDVRLFLYDHLFVNDLWDMARDGDEKSIEPSPEFFHLEIPQSLNVFIFTMPEPEIPGEGFYSLLFDLYGSPSERRYFTLELGEGGSVFLCEWQGATHLNYGECGMLNEIEFYFLVLEVILEGVEAEMETKVG